MKKIISIACLILFSSNLLAQSILLIPNKVESKQLSSIDNIILQSTNQPNILGKRQNGTLAAPTTVLTGDDLLSLQASAYNGSAFTGFVANQDWTSTANGTDMQFYTTESGTTDVTEKVVIKGNVSIGGGVDGLMLHIMVTGPVKLKIHLLSPDAINANKIVFEDENENWIIDSVKTFHGHGGCTLIYDGIDSLWRVIN